MIILSILSVLLFLIGGFFAYKYYKLKNLIEKPQYDDGTGKEGLVKVFSEYRNLYGTIGYCEVEEIKTAGDKTKVRILKSICNNRKDEFEKKQLIEGSCRWIETDAITWMDNWEKDMRNKKLNELLGEK